MDLSDYFDQFSDITNFKDSPTFNYFIPKQDIEKVNFICNEDVVFFGQEVLTQGLNKFCPDHKIKWYFKDGDLILKNQTIALIEAPKSQLYLNADILLKLIRQLTGQLTLLHCYSELAEKHNTNIVAYSESLQPIHALENSMIAHASTQNKQLINFKKIIIDHYICLQFESAAEAKKHFQDACPGPLAFRLQKIQDIEILQSIDFDHLIIENLSLTEIKKCLESTKTPKSIEVLGDFSLDHIKPLAEFGVNYINISPLLSSTAQAKLSFDL